MASFISFNGIIPVNSKMEISFTSNINYNRIMLQIILFLTINEMETNNYKVELQLHNHLKPSNKYRKIILCSLGSSRKNSSHSVLNVNGRQSESVFLLINLFYI